jgi:hypothetical protein
MPARARLSWHRIGWLRHLAILLAAVSQLAGVALLPLLEGHEGRGVGTHIEAVGNKTHYVHDETTCGACHVRSMHGRVVLPPRVPAPRDVAVVPYAPSALRPPLADRTPANLTRAPPSVI